MAIYLFRSPSPELRDSSPTVAPVTPAQSPLAPSPPTKAPESFATENTTADAVRIPERASPKPAARPDPATLNAPIHDILLRSEDGKSYYSTLAEAQKACSARGMRLPTIRELARLAVARGAKGIKEASEKPPPDRIVEAHDVKTPGYKLVRTLEADGTADEFYYDRSGYQEPDPGLQEQMAWGDSQGGTFNDPSAPIVMIMQFWSSSRNQDTKSWRKYYFFGLNGYIFAHDREGVSLVRCVMNSNISPPSGDASKMVAPAD